MTPFQVDKRRAELYEIFINEKMEIAGANRDSNPNAKIEELQEAIDSIKGNKGIWSSISQCVITFVLIATFWVLCFSIQENTSEIENSGTSINATTMQMQPTQKNARLISGIDARRKSWVLTL